MLRHVRTSAGLVVALLLLTTASAQPTPPVSQPSNCTRADIVTAVTDNPNWNSTVALITLLNATYLLPDSTGPGTLLLPTNQAFRNLRVTPQRLVAVHGTRMVAVLAYHSLINQGAALSQAQLLAASPIQSDLGVLASAGEGDNVTVPVFVNDTSGGVVAQGLYTPDVGRFGREIRVCGLALHEINVLLRPAPFQNIPDVADYFNGTVPANIGSLTSPGGLAAAIQNGTIQVANVPYNGTTLNGTTGGNGTSGGAGAASAAAAAAAAAVAGRVLSGANNTLSSSGPVLLAGTVTPRGGGNGTAPVLGPGLIYLNGTVQGNRGVNGTATLVESVSRSGAQLTNVTTPLAGAIINGTGFDAGNLTATPAAAAGGGTRQFNGTDGATSTAAAVGAFGSALVTNPDGTFNATAGQPVLLSPGTVANGTALNDTAATGSAANGNLGPGAILVNGTVDSGTGVNGTAYPIVAITPRGVVANRNNGVNITDATLSGTALNGTGIPAQLQNGNGTGSGAAAAGAGASAAVAGAALALNGSNGTLSTTGPALLAGTVTPVSGSSSDETAPALGPGLIYLNGTVQDGRGVNGTATLVRSLGTDGAQLTNATTPLEGAVVNGTAVDARNLTTTPAAAGANDTRQLNGTNGILSTVVAAGAFGSALAAGPDGTVNTTAGQPVLLDGRVVNGTALNATAATGSARNGNLGPGAILVNGTTNSGTGVSGTAYPVTAITPNGIVVNRDNGVNITDANLSGRAFNGTGVPVRQQTAAAAAAAAAAAGAAGAAAGAGAAGGPAGAPGSSDGAGAAGAGGSGAGAPDSASAAADGPTADLVDNLGTDTTVTPQGQSAAGLAAGLALPLGSAAVAALLLAAAA